MQSTLTLSNWIEHLRYLAPITGLVHIGAGAGKDAANYAEWGIPAVLLIEAEESYAEKLAAIAANHAGWSAHTALISDHAGEQDYYHASNPNESGVLSPEKLTGLWRNLKTREQRRINATTLDHLVTTQSHSTAAAINWVVVDCIPAMSAIRGATQQLVDCDVVIARVILDETQLSITGAGKIELDAYLSGIGFRCIACEEELQPAIGRVLYARDWKAILGESAKELRQTSAKQANALSDMQAKLEEHSRLANDRQQKITELTQARDAQTKHVAERQAQIEQLTKAKEEQTRQAAEHQAKTQQITQVRDEQTKLANERQHKIAELTQSSDTQAKLVAERQAQIEQLTKAKEDQTKQAAEHQAKIQQITQVRDEQTKLANERQQQIAELTQVRDKQAKLVTEGQIQIQLLIKTRDEQEELATDRQRQIEDLHKRLQQTEAQNIEFVSRQAMLQEEMLRAEAQIDLIKDVLLREPGL